MFNIIYYSEIVNIDSTHLLTINEGPRPLNKQPLNKPPSSLIMVKKACRIFLHEKNNKVGYIIVEMTT